MDPTVAPLPAAKDYDALTEKELAQATAGVRPSAGKIIGIGLALTAAAGIAGTSAVATLMPAPEMANYQVDTTGTLAPNSQLSTTVHNPDGVLSDADEQRLLDDANRLNAPAVVNELHYIVFANNDDNINDTVEEYLRDNAPQLIGDDYFTDGVLIVGVGLDPRQSFVFAGNDVADALDLWEGSHLDDAVNAIQPGVRDNNIPAGLFAGASFAMDTEQLATDRYNAAKSNRIAGMIGAGVGLGSVVLPASLGLGFYRRSQARKAAKARAEFDVISRHYGDLAQRLDQIDIRAHSLSSPFANATMREQWTQVRDHFQAIHQQVSALPSLDSDTPDDTFRKHAEEIHEAAVTTRQVGYAEENIDKLFALEHGDATLRRNELSALREDMVEAQVSLDDTDSGLYRELERVRERVEELMAAPQAPDFLDQFALLLGDYRIVLEQLRAERLDDIKLDDATALRAPAIYDRDYRPGYGYNNFVPFWTITVWHESNQQTQSSSGSSNTSFSSGFSGAGGSSSF